MAPSRQRADQPIRVLIVEDSRAQRELLLSILSGAGFVVAGTAANGREAVEAAARLRPDVIAMDIHLPVLDGYEATRQIMQLCPTPIVMMSSAAGDNCERSVQSLAVGALAVVQKPGSPTHADFAGEKAALLRALRLMADVPVVTRFPERAPVAGHPAPAASSVARPGMRAAPHLVAIAASTGGPAAVQTVLQGLGGNFPLPILLVQHIAKGFVAPLAEWLDGTVPLTVLVGRQGERMAPGHVYLAPETHHLTVAEYGRLGLRPASPDDRYCPSADVLFDSAAKICGARAVGVILTGMGDDGARGLRALHLAGGYTVAQEGSTCVVDGMPRAAIQRGAASQIVPLDLIASAVVACVGVAPSP